MTIRLFKFMKTIMLDHDQKNRILKNINEYLHFSTSR